MYDEAVLIKVAWKKLPDYCNNGNVKMNLEANPLSYFFSEFRISINISSRITGLF